MLDDEGYRHTLRIYNTYCFSMASMATQWYLNVICTLPSFFLSEMAVVYFFFFLLGEDTWENFMDFKYRHVNTDSKVNYVFLSNIASVLNFR